MVFDDEATTPFSYASGTHVPFTGSFTPASPLSAFDGQNGNGTWTLTVAGLLQRSDVGSIRAFSVHVTTAGVTATKTVTGDFVEGGTVTYEITATNNNGRRRRATTRATRSSTSCLTVSRSRAPSPPPALALFNFATNTVTWNGAFPAAGDGDVVLTIEATVDEGTENQTLNNQATINFDADDDGDNESSTVSDDPGDRRRRRSHLLRGRRDPADRHRRAGPATIDPVGGVAPVPFDVVFSEPVTGFTAAGRGPHRRHRPRPLDRSSCPARGPSTRSTVSGMTGQGTVTAARSRRTRPRTRPGTLNTTSTSVDNSITVSRPPGCRERQLHHRRGHPARRSTALAGVLANDTDADSNATLEAVLVDAPTHGTLTLADDGSFDYDPDPDYQGPDSFAYYADDGIFWSEHRPRVDRRRVGGRPARRRRRLLQRRRGRGADSHRRHRRARQRHRSRRGHPRSGADRAAGPRRARPRRRRVVHLHPGRPTSPAPTPSPMSPTTAASTARRPRSPSPWPRRPVPTRNQYVDDVYQVLLGRHADRLRHSTFWSGQLAGWPVPGRLHQRHRELQRRHRHPDPVAPTSRCSTVAPTPPA